MSDQKLQLPDFLIADLYKQSLVEIGNIQEKPKAELKKAEPTVEQQVNNEKGLQYLGENKKNVIIIVNQPQTAYLDDKDLHFLTNVLKACSLTLADIAIINLAHQEVIFSTLKEQLGAVHIFMFDVEPTNIKVPFVAPHFQVQKYDATTVVYLPTLAEMNLPTEESVQMKRNLWTSLKKVFNL